MKIIAGAILIVAASILYHARTELAGSQTGYDERMGMIWTCLIGTAVTGVAGIVLIGAELRNPMTDAKVRTPISGGVILEADRIAPELSPHTPEEEIAVLKRSLAQTEAKNQAEVVSPNGP